MKKLIISSVLCFITFLTQAQKVAVTYHQATVKALYLNCGNELFVNICNYPNLKGLRFEAENAEIIKDENANKITLVPNAAKVVLRVFEGDSLLSSEAFPVRLLPKPNITVFLGTRPIFSDDDQTFSISELAAITVRTLAESGIRDAIPKDCRYKASDISVYLERNGSKVGEPLSSKEERIDLEEFLKDAKKGDRVVVEVKGVKRLNFRNDMEDVKVGTAVFGLSIE